MPMQKVQCLETICMCSKCPCAPEQRSAVVTIALAAPMWLICNDGVSGERDGRGLRQVTLARCTCMPTHRTLHFHTAPHAHPVSARTSSDTFSAACMAQRPAIAATGGPASAAQRATQPHTTSTSFQHSFCTSSDSSCFSSGTRDATTCWSPARNEWWGTAREWRVGGAELKIANNRRVVWHAVSQAASAIILEG